MSPRLLPGITAATIALMLLMHLTLLANGLGWPMPVPFIANLGIGALLAGLGYASRNLPPNPVVGLRTPTTLRDPDAWRRGNRVAGNGMMIAGVATMLAAPLPAPWPLIVMLAGPLIVCIAGVIAARGAEQRESENG